MCLGKHQHQNWHVTWLIYFWYLLTHFLPMILSDSNIPCCEGPDLGRLVPLNSGARKRLLASCLWSGVCTVCTFNSTLKGSRGFHRAFDFMRFTDLDSYPHIFGPVDYRQPSPVEVRGGLWCSNSVNAANRAGIARLVDTVKPTQRRATHMQIWRKASKREGWLHVPRKNGGKVRQCRDPLGRSGGKEPPVQPFWMGVPTYHCMMDCTGRSQLCSASWHESKLWRLYHLVVWAKRTRR